MPTDTQSRDNRPASQTAFALAVVGSFVLSLPLGALLYFGLVGIGSENGDTPGMLQDPLSVGTITAFLSVVGVAALVWVTSLVHQRSRPSPTRRVSRLALVAAATVPVVFAISAVIG